MAHSLMTCSVPLCKHNWAIFRHRRAWKASCSHRLPSQQRGPSSQLFPGGKGAVACMSVVRERGFQPRHGTSFCYILPWFHLGLQEPLSSLMFCPIWCSEQRSKGIRWELHRSSTAARGCQSWLIQGTGIYSTFPVPLHGRLTHSEGR